MYDADWYEIKELQGKLEQNGISKEQLNLDQYAGLTYRELSGIVESAIASKKKELTENG